MSWLHAILGDADIYIALFIALTVVNLLPPVPAEMVIPLSATLFANDAMNLPLAILAASAGLVLGTLPLYYLGRSLGKQRCKQLLQRHRRWLAVTPADIDRSARWFRRYGAALVLVGRLIPGMRSLVSVPAGFHGMPLSVFLFWTTLGSSAWASLLILAGHWLSHAVPGLTAFRMLIALMVVFGVLYARRLVWLARRND